MSRIRSRRMTDREAMWLRYGQATAFQEDAIEAKRIGNEMLRRGDGSAPVIEILIFAAETRDIEDRALYASRRCSHLRLRGSR